jgi:hypothetical protein
MRFPDLEEETFAMEHYEYDTFTWWFSRNDCARRSRFTNYGYKYFRNNFAGKAGMSDWLMWKTASQLKESDMLMRVPK